MSNEACMRPPLCLLLPGLGNSGPTHWQSRWESARGDCVRVDLGMWNAPVRNHWVTKLDQAVGRAPAPLILVAHGLACHAIAWWAKFVGQPYGWPVAGALLVAPPDVEQRSACDSFKRFAPAPAMPLPFPAIVVASADDPHSTPQRSREMALKWQCHFTDIGHHGHINADAGLGDWVEGQLLLERLIGMADRTSPRRVPTMPVASLHGEHYPLV